mmetsp:Transcript_27444/g.81762  ORF Transcript_27444/g.81762 Transcript_27444/m.81762 type:complete len:424 (-) Transcript_27444:20-1291(-)
MALSAPGSLSHLRGPSHLLLVVTALLVVIVVIVTRRGRGRRCSGGLVVLLLLRGQLDLANGLPLLGEGVGLGPVVGDEDVVEDGAALDLPEVEADEAEVGVLVHLVVVLVLGVGDLLRLPHALVGRVGDALHVPVALVVRIVDHRSLPLAVLLVVPVVRLLGRGVDDALLLHPVVRLLVLRVVHHGVIGPVGGLLVLGVADLLGLQELPVVLHAPRVDLLLVDLDLDGVVRLHGQPVEVGGALALLLVGQVRLLEDVLPLVREDEVRPLRVAALVRSEHDVVDRRVAEGGKVILLGANLEVASAALHILLVLRLILDDEVLARVAERVEPGGDAEELGVLRSLDASVLLLVREPLARSGDPLPRGPLGVLPLAVHPSALPAVAEGLREVDLAAGNRQRPDAQRPPHLGLDCPGGHWLVAPFWS